MDNFMDFSCGLSPKYRRELSKPNARIVKLKNTFAICIPHIINESKIIYTEK